MALQFPFWYDIYKLEVITPFAIERRNIKELITQIDVSYTIDLASQLSFQVMDPQGKFSAANYFQVRREVLLTEISSGDFKVFEIAAVSYGPGDVWDSPNISVECRPKAIQELKRDKKVESFKSMSATEFAAIAAERVGLKIYGESTLKVQSIVKSRSSDSDESMWDVLRRLAGDNQFVVFESDGTLFFCSERFLIGKLGSGEVGTGIVQRPAYPGVDLQSGDSGEAVELLQNALRVVVDGQFGPATKKAVQDYQRFFGFTAGGIVDKILWDHIFGILGANWNYVPIVYPIDESNENYGKFDVLEYPTIRRSDDDPYEADGSIVLSKPGGTLIRPGMTLGLKTPNPHINGAYLVTEVAYPLGGSDPVRISFRTPAPLQPKKVGA
jgi:peptidoglycan hydrolase-like protein with peptidoglycan-binding domain